MKGKSRTEQDAIVAHAVDNTPCWNCGVVGHLKPDCPQPSTIIDMKRSPPTMEMDVSEIITAKTDKYERYRTLLAQYLEMSSGEQIICQPVINNNSTESAPTGHDEPLAKKLKITNSIGSFTARVEESGLTTVGSTHQQDGNWNSRRKSIFIVVDR
jgi:Zinc knuckle